MTRALRSTRSWRHIEAAFPALALAVFSPSAYTDSPVTATVDIQAFAFSPDEITVEPGTRVRWVNHDETPHSVRSRSASTPFSSPGLDTGDVFDVTFTGEGDVTYVCTLHPMMSGTVHVRRAARPAGERATEPPSRLRTRAAVPVGAWLRSLAWA